MQLRTCDGQNIYLKDLEARRRIVDRNLPCSSSVPDCAISYVSASHTPCACNLVLTCATFLFSLSNAGLSSAQIRLLGTTLPSTAVTTISLEWNVIAPAPSSEGTEGQEGQQRPTDETEW